MSQKLSTSTTSTVTPSNNADNNNTSSEELPNIRPPDIENHNIEAQDEAEEEEGGVLASQWVVFRGNVYDIIQFTREGDGNSGGEEGEDGEVQSGGAVLQSVATTTLETATQTVEGKERMKQCCVGKYVDVSRVRNLLVVIIFN